MTVEELDNRNRNPFILIKIENVKKKAINCQCNLFSLVVYDFNDVNEDKYFDDTNSKNDQEMIQIINFLFILLIELSIFCTSVIT